MSSYQNPSSSSSSVKDGADTLSSMQPPSSPPAYAERNPGTGSKAQWHSSTLPSNNYIMSRQQPPISSSDIRPSVVSHRSSPQSTPSRPTLSLLSKARAKMTASRGDSHHVLASSGAEFERQQKRALEKGNRRQEYERLGLGERTKFGVLGAGGWRSG
ncbi:hypothetical protein B0A49_10468 [Cryomyces minteri]|uniref:Uncharacterized protein n=1 Tax=Cryomyces minteri TaxID=331657 RepID=A0A4U0WQB3_9PEZI|nr:hypothetical protein B0A49_10468 [Cryomyces minteri]